MENIEKKNSTASTLSIIASLLLIAGGIGLGAYLIGLVPMLHGASVGKLILSLIAIAAPIGAGCLWLGMLYRRKKSRDGYRPAMGGVAFGILLILIGLLLMCFATGIVPVEWRKVFISWQMLIILIGLSQLCKRHVTGGFTALAIGIFFLVPRIVKAFPYAWNAADNFTALYWPVLLVVAGTIIVLSVIFRPRMRPDGHHNRHRNRRCTGHKFQEGVKSAETDDDGKIKYSLVFTGLEQVFLEPEFRGGEISNTFAGLELDLRRTKLPEGTTYLKVDLIFAGANIYMPADWRVEIRSQSVLGAFTDKRPFTEYADTDDRKLVIVANCVFGGGEIK